MFGNGMITGDQGDAQICREARVPYSHRDAGGRTDDDASIGGSDRIDTDCQPVGTWTSANGHGVVEIAQCGDALRGRIVVIERSTSDPMPTDVRGRPQCGLTIITNQKPKVDGTWWGGITDPRDGRTNQAILSVDEGGKPHLRDFIGIPQLGATQIWHKFAGHLTNECRSACGPAR
jgi:uncharacterized protein (DUF2147 family)